MAQQATDEQEDDEDVIDINNPEDLARRGLQKIFIEGEGQEYLMDQDGNIYTLEGEFVGQTGLEDKPALRPNQL